MTKAMPPGSPDLYYHLAEASYKVKSEARNYLDKIFGSGVIRVLDQADPSTIIGGSWKMTLFEDTRSGELCVGFEGTNSIRNRVGDFFHHLADPKGLLKDMGKIADKWVKKYKKNIWSFVGHSEGGFLATHVKKSWDTFRVTFNAHKAERGVKNINLRLHKDPVSGPFVSVKDRYFTLDSGEGHSLEAFKDPLCGKEWSDLDAKRFSPPIQTQAQPQLLSQSQISSQTHDQAQATVLSQSPQQGQAQTQDQTTQAAESEDDKKKDTLIAAAAGAAVFAGAYVGYKIVSESCNSYELEEEDKSITKTCAKVGGVLGGVGTTALVISSGTTTGLSIASIASGTVALGGGSVVAGLGAVFALPAAAAIGAGWIGHKVYQRYYEN